MRRSFICLAILLTLSTYSVVGQNFYRIRADFSVKSKDVNGTQSLTMGQVCYDRNIRQILYYLNFPDAEIWLTADTTIFRIRDNKVMEQIFSPSIAEFSVFHLALNSHLQDFGLRSSSYALSDVSKEAEMVISTWTPPVKFKDKLGEIIISSIDKRLYGVVFMDPEGTPQRKQFFQDYLIQNGLAFPTKITEIYYAGGKEGFQVTTFKNIKVDEIENDSLYYYPLYNIK